MTAAEYYFLQGEKKVAINALKKGCEVEFVAEITDLDINTIEALKRELDKS